MHCRYALGNGMLLLTSPLKVPKVLANIPLAMYWLPYSSSASCTPYWGTSGEAGFASPLNSVATCSGGHKYPIMQTARISTARSRQPTSNATAHAIVEEVSSTDDLKHAVSGGIVTITITLLGRN
jgi:hypothetical protein